jgi:hypothetical protein
VEASRTEMMRVGGRVVAWDRRGNRRVRNGRVRERCILKVSEEVYGLGMGRIG